MARPTNKQLWLGWSPESLRFLWVMGFGNLHLAVISRWSPLGCDPSICLYHYCSFYWAGL